MQTNREDVGRRYLEIEVPLPPDAERAREVSEPFRTYFTAIAKARDAFRAYLDRTGDHHFFVSGGEMVADVGLGAASAGSEIGVVAVPGA
jgi:type I restriction enzyme M protein